MDKAKSSVCCRIFSTVEKVRSVVKLGRLKWSRANKFAPLLAAYLKATVSYF